MSTPIFDALYAESDDATRALVWPAPSTDPRPFTDQMTAFGRAFAAIARLDTTPHKNSDQVRSEGLLGGLEL